MNGVQGGPRWTKVGIFSLSLSYGFTTTPEGLSLFLKQGCGHGFAKDTYASEGPVKPLECALIPLQSTLQTCAMHWFH